MGRGLLSEHRLHVQQERDLEREGCAFRAPRRRVRHDHRSGRDRHGCHPERKRKMVKAQVAAHLRNYKASGAELIMGSARFVAPKTLEVNLNDGGTRLLAGDKVFINVGTHAAIPDVSGLAAAKPLTHIEALELDDLPRHLIVLGGG
jgi:pyruvate/2-oxoglutarate dehydrogenase complex dihydrolipoamide dehydrogenase (E3) component